ncbi:MAG TPA: 16S rRNA (guanine(966)-N(2))-methyltransferase RsmD [Candidatus Limnocylindria bacterium]|nr:16S rRNA (guanine(966)-N(2))-methyltransferase RsmD [Candidatus Limnocylindria bacterium]
MTQHDAPVRVIAGSARGIVLRAPQHRKTRPVTDRVKETLFAILGERVLGANVLDLYAGSGALGIEALSRGAERATFVERGRDALAAIRHNLERTRLAASASVCGGDVQAYLEHAPPEAPFDLAFVDPPYAERAILAPLERLVPLLAPRALVVIKHFWRTEVRLPTGLEPWRERRFGETALTFVERSTAGRTDGVEDR